MKAFLQQVRQELAAAAAPKPIVYVLGNEGGDMDSVVSALFGAFYFTESVKPCKFSLRSAVAEGAAPSRTGVVVPVCNFPKGDLKLRHDIEVATARHGITPDDLFWIADFPLAKADYLVLVDHNRLSPAQREFESKVAAIIDHHTDEGASLEAIPRNIQVPTGSCSSLVALMLQSEGIKFPDPQLLQAALLLDTSNLESKAVPADIQAGEFLTKKSVQAWYKELQAAKKAVGSLTFDEVLRRDFKEFEVADVPTAGGKWTYGMSSFVELLDDVLERTPTQEFVDTLASFCASKRLNVQVLLLSKKVGEQHRRDLLLFKSPEGDNQKVFDYLCDVLQNHPATAPMGLTVRDTSSYTWFNPQSFCYLAQRDGSYSRKQITGMLQEAFANPSPTRSSL